MDEKELFLKKFEEKLRDQLDPKSFDKLSNGDFSSDYSVDYEKFRLESLPRGFGFYERLCSFCEKTLPIAPDKKTKEQIDKNLFDSHLNCSATGVQSTTIFVSMIIVLVGLALLLVSMTIAFGVILIGLVSYMMLQKIPSLYAKRLRTKANDEVIIAIFYIVAFMRFNSNFELAVNFAASYLNPPLSLDFKRILWDLENSKYPNIQKAFDVYLEGWRDDNLEFLEAIYLIESSLYEGDNARRISLLDKSLDIILQGNYEKMLHFAQDLRGSVTTFNMLGVVLPILGLIILPLAASFIDPRSIWQFVLLLYDIIIPFFVGYMGFMIIFNRPTSVNSIRNPKNIKGLVNMQKFALKLSKDKTIYISPKIPALFIFLVFLVIGFLPIIFHNIGVDEVINERLANMKTKDSSAPFFVFQEYKAITPDGGSEYTYGPYGVYPAILSLFIPMSFAFGIGYYLRYKYKNLIHLRDRTKKLEVQFPSAMFQLGNRINEGIAAELAFGAVADTMKGTEAGKFFSEIDGNIKFEGMSVERAIFDDEKGAINTYPSDLVISSMKILVRAIEKGPEVTAKTLIDLSRYLNEIHMAAERMKDLLAESLSSMKSQASFLAPVISGVVISIVSLVTMIMGVLSDATEELSAEGTSQLPNILGESIPTYLFQSVVGIYMVLLMIILVYMVINLENGEDPILLKYEIGEKLIKGMTKYSIVVFFGVVLFTYIGSKVLGNIT